MAEQNDWILKIISGPHQGVEELFPEGRLVVGMGRDCGIVLQDVLVAPQHFALTRKGNNVTVEALGGRTYCGGKRVTAPTAVPAFAFVTAGTTHVVLGPAAGTWPLLSAADAPELEKDPPPAPTAADTPAGTKAEGNPAPEAAAVPAGKLEGSTPAAPSPEQRRRAWWLAGFGGLLLLVWLVLWLLLRPAPSEPARPGPRARTERVLDSIPGGNRVRIEERGNQLALSGYVDSDAAHRDLIAALRAEVPEASLRLWSTPRIAETARELLASRKLNLTLKPGENGELTVAGTAPSAPEWAVARQLLLAEVPGLQRIIDEVTLPKEPEKVAKAPAEPPVAPDQALSVIALQTAPEAPAWVRLANGAVYFTGASFQGVATFTGLESAKARFEHAGGATLFGLGDNLGVLLAPRPAPGPAAPTAAEAPLPPPAPPQPSPSAPPTPAPNADRTEAKTAATEPTAIAGSRPDPAEVTPAPAAPATPVQAEPGPAPAPTRAQPVTTSPSSGAESSATSPSAAPVEAPAAEPTSLPAAKENTATPEVESAVGSPAVATAAVETNSSPHTEPTATEATATVAEPVAVDRSGATLAEVPGAPTIPAPTTAEPAASAPLPARTAETKAEAATLEVPPTPTMGSAPEASAGEIQVIREALQAWEAGDLAAGKRALTLLARLLPEQPAGRGADGETRPRTLALQHGWGGPVR